MHKTLILFPIVALLIVLGMLSPLTQASAQTPTATPTDDPLAEPPLSANPTELELGRNLYWHWCMTCHGDRGQGLTDEWRAVWVADHQNCWARGCHAGHHGDTAFPIPTVIPAIVGAGNLSRFASFSDLYNYLKGTHPPQHPGILEDREYHAIAAYVFTLNNRVVEENTATPMPSPTLSVTPTLIPASPTITPPPTATAQTFTWVFLPIGLGLLGVIVLFLRFHSKHWVSGKRNE